jgi:hypothetical protein
LKVSKKESSKVTISKQASKQARTDLLTYNFLNFVSRVSDDTRDFLFLARVPVIARSEATKQSKNGDTALHKAVSPFAFKDLSFPRKRESKEWIAACAAMTQTGGSYNA